MGSSASKQDEENKVEVLNASFLWKTKNYSKLPETKWINSPSFTISGLSYQLELHKDGDLPDKGLKIRLNAVQTFSEALKFRCRISVLDKVLHEHHTKIKDITVKKDKNDEVIFEVKDEDLKKGKLKKSLLPDDTLTISFKMTALNDEDPSGEDSASLLEALSCDLGKFLQDQVNTDTVLKADNKQFPAHRAVLAARSKVFEAMFRHDTCESRSSVVNIKDVDANTLEEALYYIYTGKVPRLTAGTAHSLFEFADKYALAELREACTKSLISSLTVGNVCKAAILADLFEVSPLKSAIVTLVRDNLDQVLNSEHWGSFSMEKPIIANSILSETLLAARS